MPDFPGVSPRGDVYVAHPYNPATKRKIHLGTAPTPEEAYELVRDWKRGRVRDRTVAGVRAAWLELHVNSEKAGLVDSTIRQYTARTLLLEERFGASSPDELYDQFEIVQAWAADQSTTCVETCSAMFEWARKKRLCKSNPLEGVEGRPEKRRQAKTVLDEHEVRDLAAIAQRKLKGARGQVMAALILVEFGSMLRPAHLFKLRWRDLDFESGRIAAPAVKRGRPQDVAMLPIAREGFELLPTGLPDTLVFTNSRGTAMKKNTLSLWFEVVRAAADYDDMVFYDLKTAGVSRLIHAGVSPSDLAKQLTHADNGETLMRHYTDLNIETCLKAVEEADSVATEQANSRISVAGRSQTALGGAA